MNVSRCASSPLSPQNILPPFPFLARSITKAEGISFVDKAAKAKHPQPPVKNYRGSPALRPWQYPYLYAFYKHRSTPMRKRILSYSLLALLCLGSGRFSLQAQQTSWQQSPESELRQALDLFDKEMFSAARQAFFELMHRDAIREEGALYAEAAYYEALCAIELFNQDSKDLLLGFVENFPENNHTNRVHFNLARSSYQKKHYRSAIRYFEKVSLKDLEQEERYEYHFKKGYSHLREDDFATARKEFASVKDASSRYSAPVNYYYAHLAYIDGDNETALAGFAKIQDDPTFKAIVPHYQTQIYYRQGQWDKVTQLGSALLSSTSGKRNAEFNRMMGDAFFYQEDYANAIPYLASYNAAPGQRTGRSDQYQLAMAYFLAADYAAAISWFQQVAGPEDSLSQNAYYHLGYCFIQTEEKEFSRQAFLSAFKTDFDMRIKEDALFNYAKLAYELSHNPFNEAIRALQTYILEYPQSDRLDEAYTYLVDLFLSTRNYGGALEALESIRILSPELREAYQRVAYYQGIERYNSRDYQEAIALFHKSMEFDMNREIKAQALFWTGESYYQQKQFRDARTYYERFLTSPGSFSLDIYPATHYHIAYTFYTEKAYAEAATAFRKFLASPGSSSPRMLADANVRTGDAYFIRKLYREAIPYYEAAIKLAIADQDYALFQRAMAMGVMDQTRDKISNLEKLTRDYPRSPYRDNALYELGTTLLLVQEEDKALQFLRKIPQEHPGSAFEKKALLRVGLILYNRHLDDQAISTLKKVIEDYPGSAEAREALAVLRTIYVDLNETEAFFTYTAGLGFGSVSEREQDSLLYLAAENQYMNGKQDAALEGFNHYLSRFQRGMFRIQASFYRAEILFQRGERDKALADYEKVLEAPGAFTETTHLRLSSIHFGKKDYQKALTYYQELTRLAGNPQQQLTAQTGIMRCHHYLGQDAKAIEAAGEVLSSPQATDLLIVEAHLITARSKMALGDPGGAASSFGITSKLDRGIMGAEAKYYLCYLHYQSGDMEASEKAIFELINQYPAYDHWMARGFILLSDVYVKKDNLFQAKQTLYSVIDNHEGAELVQIARDKLANIEQKEAGQLVPEEGTEEKDDFEDLF